MDFQFSGNNGNVKCAWRQNEILFLFFAQASGVKVHEDCKTEFDNMKLKHAYKYVIFRLSDDLKSIIVDSCGDKCK